MKRAAGTLLYRQGKQGLEVLLVHSSGNYNRGKPWSIPKGEPDAADADLEATARRETAEETGVEAAGPLVPLGTMKYKKSGKEIHAFAGAAPADAAPRCASWEVDEACFLPMDAARLRLHPDQLVFLDRLEELLKRSPE
jgi:predicted NUDIX family NTP pyrophosphohydrolase